MGLFGKKKEKKECCCSGGCTPEGMEQAMQKKTEGSAVKVLGSGCAKCNQLEKSVREALENLGMDTNIEHVTDFSQIAAYGVMTTPALVVDGKVVSYGKVLSTSQAEEVLRKARG
ncbi:MAG: thioredoxin family protein [Blautia sp.]